MDDTVADELVAIGLTSAKRIKIVLIMFLQWLLGTGSVNATACSNASNAMHTDQVNTLPNNPLHCVARSVWHACQDNFIFIQLVILKCRIILGACRADSDLYFGGEAALAASEAQHAFTCPFCSKMGFTETTLQVDL